MRACRIIKAGILTTVQDLGRRGNYSFGIPPSGAFDRTAFSIGNVLLGNEANAAGLEILLAGARIEFLERTWIAITGADLDPNINGKRTPMWEVIPVLKGDILRFAGRKNGLRAYVLFAGGIDVPEFLNSRSTYLFLEKGGYQGRKLKEGDVLSTFDIGREVGIRRVSEAARPDYSLPWKLRMVYGLQYDYFLEDSLREFESSSWEVTTHSDRMGLRLLGSALKFKVSPESKGLGGKDPSNIVTEGNPLGTIECTSGQELIILGPDGPCEGGYTKIGTVITADFSKLAQVMPGENITFEAIPLDQAYGELGLLQKKIEKPYEEIAER